jgi:hypothetical protein
VCPIELYTHSAIRTEKRHEALLVRQLAEAHAETGRLCAELADENRPRNEVPESVTEPMGDIGEARGVLAHDPAARVREWRMCPKWSVRVYTSYDGSWLT